MKLTPWMILLSLTVVACSGSKSAQKVSEETPQIELSDADEFIENPTEEAVVADEAPVELSDNSIAADETPTETASDSAMVVEDSSPEIAMESTPVQSFESGSMQEYTVQKNETLMLIAFKLFGDYEKWKELASYNRDALKGSTVLKEGMTIKYMAPAEAFVWNPQGLPYLIRTGDTLGGISQNVYASIKKWKSIWDNNRPLIKDPNKIYAGFTIYYLEDGREVASEN